MAWNQTIDWGFLAEVSETGRQWVTTSTNTTGTHAPGLWQDILNPDVPLASSLGSYTTTSSQYLEAEIKRRKEEYFLPSRSFNIHENYPNKQQGHSERYLRSDFERWLSKGSLPSGGRSTKSEPYRSIHIELTRWVRDILDDPNLCAKIFTLGVMGEPYVTDVRFDNLQQTTTDYDKYYTGNHLRYTVSVEAVTSSAIGQLLHEHKLTKRTFSLTEMLPRNVLESSYRHSKVLSGSSIFEFLNFFSKLKSQGIGIDLGKLVCEEFLRRNYLDAQWVKSFNLSLKLFDLQEYSERISKTRDLCLQGHYAGVMSLLLVNLLKGSDSSAKLLGADQPLTATPPDEKGGDQAQLF